MTDAKNDGDGMQEPHAALIVPDLPPKPGMCLHVNRRLEAKTTG